MPGRLLLRIINIKWCTVVEECKFEEGEVVWINYKSNVSSEVTAPTRNDKMLSSHYDLTLTQAILICTPGVESVAEK